METYERNYMLCLCFRDQLGQLLQQPKNLNQSINLYGCDGSNELEYASLRQLLHPYPFRTGAPLCAELIYGDSNTKLTFPLEKDADYDVDTGYLTVHIRIQDGAARFVDSPCPDHICESFGWLSEEDQTATCLPARAVLSIIPTT